MFAQVCYFEKGGYFIALRGASGEEEIKLAKKAISEMGFVQEEMYEECLLDGAKRIISFLKKTKTTPLKFPRNYSMIKKKPL